MAWYRVARYTAVHCGAVTLSNANLYEAYIILKVIVSPMDWSGTCWGRGKYSQKVFTRELQGYGIIKLFSYYV